MYCSTCGNEIKTELNYCNRCGARVDKIENGGDGSSAAYLSMATGFICLGGLGLTLGLIGMLLRNSVNSEVIVMLTLAFLATIFATSFLMIQQISRMTKSTSSEKVLDKAGAHQLGVINTAQLEEYRQPTMSVTDNTTRTLDKVLLKEN